VPATLLGVGLIGLNSSRSLLHNRKNAYNARLCVDPTSVCRARLEVGWRWFRGRWFWRRFGECPEAHRLLRLPGGSQRNEFAARPL